MLSAETLVKYSARTSLSRLNTTPSNIARVSARECVCESRAGKVAGKQKRTKLATLKNDYLHHQSCSCNDIEKQIRYCTSAEPATPK